MSDKDRARLEPESCDCYGTKHIKGTFLCQYDRGGSK